MVGITVDNIHYNVRIKYESISRAFELIEGSNTGMAINGRTIRDVLGTAYTYAMDIEPDPEHPADYDSFYQVMSQPVDTHSVVMPYGQSTMSFDAQIKSGSDTYRGIMGGYKRWTGLSITFSAIQPQRTS